MTDCETGPDWAYLNGQWCKASDLRIDVDDIGFLQGVVAVERMRTYQGRPFEVAQHLTRFAETCRFLRIGNAVQLSELPSLIDECLDRNRVDAQYDVGITLFATPGRGDFAKKPNPSDPTFVETLGIHLNRLDREAIRRRREKGQPVVVTQIVQPPPSSWPRFLKARSRLHYYLADRSAEDVHADALGILLDQDGSLTESSVANIALVIDRVIVSPPAERVLPGVTLAVIQKIARSLQIEWQERPILPADLTVADEILLFGTTTGIWSGWLVSSSQCEGAFPRHNTVCGPVFRQLVTALDQMSGGTAKKNEFRSSYE